MEYITTALNLKSIPGLFSGKKREKLDFILEPLQAMLQLSMLAFCPVGSKLTINDNLLSIQLPGMSQGIVRYLNDDAKEDLYYLFNVFKRFIAYYDHMNRTEHKHRLLYLLLIELSKSGLSNLINTYTDCNKVNVLHTLQMYKVMLGKPSLFIDGDNGISSVSEFDKKSGSSSSNTEHNKPGNIDTIFNKIVNIYTDEELIILYNVLVLLKKAEPGEPCIELMNGLTLIMAGTHSKIKKWINENIAL
jgi:hypothetical protein